MKTHNSRPQEANRRPRQKGLVAKLAGGVSARAVAVLERTGPSEIALPGTEAHMRKVKLALRGALQNTTRHGIVYQGHPHKLDAARSGSLAEFNDEKVGTTSLKGIAMFGNTALGVVTFESVDRKYKSVEVVVLPSGAHRYDNRGDRNETPRAVVAVRDISAASATGVQRFGIGSETVSGDSSLEEAQAVMSIDGNGMVTIENGHNNENGTNYVIDAQTFNTRNLGSDTAIKQYGFVKEWVDMLALEANQWDPSLTGHKF